MTSSARLSALLLFAHGSSDPGWALPFSNLKAAIEAREPDRDVELAYLERMQPSFDDAIARMQLLGIQEITVAPIFLAIGGHMRKDLPKLIDDTQLRTGIVFKVLPALGEADVLIGAIADWVTDAAK